MKYSADIKLNFDLDKVLSDTQEHNQGNLEKNRETKIKSEDVLYVVCDIGLDQDVASLWDEGV